MLYNQVFKCDIEKCNKEPLPYLKAIEHMTQCEYATTTCAHECGAVVLNSYIHKHEKLCPKKKQVCEECEFTCFVNIETFDHDCF